MKRRSIKVAARKAQREKEALKRKIKKAAAKLKELRRAKKPEKVKKLKSPKKKHAKSVEAPSTLDDSGRKTCKKCERELQFSAFRKSSMSGDGLNGTCKLCVSIKDSLNYAERPQRAMATRLWEARNPGPAKRRKRDWWMKHRSVKALGRQKPNQSEG